MGKRPVERGPVSERVAVNVRALRDARRLTLDELSRRLGRIGRPTAPGQLGKLERGERRADVDDLVALAVALDVSPNRLLLPPEAGQETVELTAEAVVDAKGAWSWATGDDALPVDLWGVEKQGVTDLRRRRRFPRENRPHDPPDTMPMTEVEKHVDVLGPVVTSVRAAQADGLALTTIIGYVRIAETGRRIAERAIGETGRRIAERATEAREEGK